MSAAGIQERDLDPSLAGELDQFDADEIPPQTEGRDAPVGRLALVVIFPLLAASVMAGGVFLGVVPRVQAAVSAVLGVLIAIGACRLRNPLVTNLAAMAALVAVGLLMVLSSGVGALVEIGANVQAAAASGDLLRPPVQYEPGWRSILGWIMAGVGFASGWAAIELRKPAIGTLIPLLIVGFAAISVPKDQQIASGIAALVLFAIGLGLLSTSGGRDEGEGTSLQYETRRAVRGIPLIAGISVLLYLVARTGLLFPDPLIDPLQEAQRPRPIPPSDVVDRVLFTVQSSIAGPWRMGHLDVYEEQDSSWRLPPFAENRLKEVPRDGVVDKTLRPGFIASFDVRGLGGAVLPGLANTVGIRAAGPELAFDSRTGTIRVSQGQVLPGVKYTVTGARLPSIEELQRITKKPPKSVAKFLEIPPPPPAVQSLLAEAPKTSPWDKMDFMRQRLLSIVVADGAGTPVSVPPDKVQDMLVGSKKGTPFEIVAGQAMLARWAGVPSRIAYGFDGGEVVAEDTYEVRPKHGAVFLEVFFEGFKWLPIIGNPVQAKSSLTDNQQQSASDVLPSDDISIEIYFPLILPPESTTIKDIRAVVGLFLLAAAVMLVFYFTYPALHKARVRARRRRWAMERGAPARIALAYSEWRDFATDLGYRHASDTPLMFLDRVADDKEHAALAWLVTRCLWGDLRGDVTNVDATVAEELSQSCQKRAAQAHSVTLRAIASVSRLSLRHPYSPSLTRANGRAIERQAA